MMAATLANLTAPKNCHDGSAPWSNNMYTYCDLQKFAKFIRDRCTCNHKPTVGIICGTGLGGLANVIEDKTVIPYEDIPGFPVSTVKGHHGQFVLGKLNGKNVICMKGRFHLYEGYPPWKVTAPVRVMAILGVKTILITNAAGGLNRSYNVGDIMIMKDHLFLPGLAGFNPLVGPNMPQFGERFTSMSQVYDSELRKLARCVGKELGFSDILKEGVYVMVGGPSFETPAELKLLSGASDVVGMSTCPEATVAKHCGMRVIGLSLVTNLCVLDYDETGETDGPNHVEVLETGKMREEMLQDLVTNVVGRMENV